MDLENKINKKSIEEVFENNSNKILPIFLKCKVLFYQEYTNDTVI